MKLNTLIFTVLLSISMTLASESNTTNDTEIATKQEGVKYIKMLGAALKTELEAHMKADKTGLSAMGFCTEKADDITKEVNTKLPGYASVRRTALKTRNEKNAPDVVDEKVMKDYEASIEAKTFTPMDIKIVKEGDTTRVYKPLVMEGVCLKCHGSNISKEIKEVITASYPQDKAIDFKEGSLRGVIVSEIKKH